MPTKTEEVESEVVDLRNHEAWGVLWVVEWASVWSRTVQTSLVEYSWRLNSFFFFVLNSRFQICNQPFFFVRWLLLTDRLDLSMRHFMKLNTGGDASTATKPSNGPRIQRWTSSRYRKKLLKHATGLDLGHTIALVQEIMFVNGSCVLGTFAPCNLQGADFCGKILWKLMPWNDDCLLFSCFWLPECATVEPCEEGGPRI